MSQDAATRQAAAERGALAVGTIQRIPPNATLARGFLTDANAALELVPVAAQTYPPGAVLMAAAPTSEPVVGGVAQPAHAPRSAASTSAATWSRSAGFRSAAATRLVWSSSTSPRSTNSPTRATSSSHGTL
jgi:hypothetical protein